MKKLHYIIVGIVVAAVSVSMGTWHLLTMNSPERATSDYLNELHLKLSQDDIPFLKEVVQKNPNQYVRERAIYIMTDIATRRDVSDEVRGLLNDLAYNEQNDSVRSAAYTNLYIIREHNPLEIDATFDLKIEGNIITGNTVDLISNVSLSGTTNEAILGIKRIVGREKEYTSGVLLSGDNPSRFMLKEGEIKESRFSLHLIDDGEYLIICSLKLGVDRVDYQIIEKTILIRVEKTGGAYQVQE